MRGGTFHSHRGSIEMKRSIQFLSPVNAAVVLGAVLACSCVREPRSDTVRKDLENNLSLVGTVDRLSTGKATLERGSGGTELLYLPFQASVRIHHDMRNYVQYAREGRYHREYVGWVLENSRERRGAELVRHTSLLENLSAEEWYEKKANELVSISGHMRYRIQNGNRAFLGVFE